MLEVKSSRCSLWAKDELARVKTSFGFSPEEHFVVPVDVANLYAEAAERGRQAEASWTENFNGNFRAQNPNEFAEIERRFFSKLFPITLFPSCHFTNLPKRIKLPHVNFRKTC